MSPTEIIAATWLQTGCASGAIASQSLSDAALVGLDVREADPAQRRRVDDPRHRLAHRGNMRRSPVWNSSGSLVDDQELVEGEAARHGARRDRRADAVDAGGDLVDGRVGSGRGGHCRPPPRRTASPPGVTREREKKRQPERGRPRRSVRGLGARSARAPLTPRWFASSRRLPFTLAAIGCWNASSLYEGGSARSCSRAGLRARIEGLHDGPGLVAQHRQEHAVPDPEVVVPAVARGRIELLRQRLAGGRAPLRQPLDDRPGHVQVQPALVVGVTDVDDAVAVARVTDRQVVVPALHGVDHRADEREQRHGRRALIEAVPGRRRARACCSWGSRRWFVPTPLP